MTRRPRIPLRDRLPNPSAVFVGREDEVAWLARALERAPVALVTGPGGVGKTALVFRALEVAFPEERERTLYLPIPAGEPADQVRLALTHLLVRAAGAEDARDIASLRGDPEELTATALDLAEEGSFWVVLDDLQHTDRAEMSELLRQLSAYARNSRFIAISRAALGSVALEGQVLEVSRLGYSALAEMARTLQPQRSAAELQTAVNAAAGSPWLLKQFLAEGAEGLALTREGVLGSLSEAARQLLATLACIEEPLPSAVVEDLVPLPPPDEREALVSRGLLVAGEDLRVHDQVGAFLFPLGTPGQIERRTRIAERLCRRDEPSAVLEALRLHGQTGDLEALLGLLDQRGHELMGLGYAPRVWRLIERTTDPRAGLWQLRCAAELGNATVLGAVREPRLINAEGPARLGRDPVPARRARRSPPHRVGGGGLRRQRRERGGAARRALSPAPGARRRSSGRGHGAGPIGDRRSGAPIVDRCVPGPRRGRGGGRCCGRPIDRGRRCRSAARRRDGSLQAGRSTASRARSRPQSSA